MNLDRLKILGGTPLNGHVAINGAKNSALAIMAASILGEDELLLENVPNLADVEIMAEVLRNLGVRVHFQSNHQVVIDPRHLNTFMAPYELVTKMRASFFVLGPLLARLGQANVPLPGGCAIGSRPVDLHLKGLAAMGAEIEIEHGNVRAKAPKLTGANVYLDFPSVGATENIMMAACLAEGTTTISNAAQEPEITDLANFLISMGAKIKGAGTETILVEGVEKLGRSTTHSIMPDRIEAGTFIIAAAMTGGNVIVEKLPQHGLQSIIGKLRECKVIIDEVDTDKVRVRRPQIIRATDIRTMPFPGFPTDLQAQFLALLTIARGTSVVTETVFENRFLHVDELQRMGANIRIEGNTAIVKGVDRLSGAPVQSTDLRAAAALILAGLAADGETTVSKLHHLDRGYEKIEEKLSQLGAKIYRISVKAEQADNILVKTPSKT